MPSLLTQPRVTLSTSTTAATKVGQPEQSNIQLPSSSEVVIDTSTPGTSVSKSTVVTLPATEQPLSLPVAIGPPHVGMACNVLNVETSSDSDINVERKMVVYMWKHRGMTNTHCMWKQPQLIDL